jgi:hypothetical protein
MAIEPAAIAVSVAVVVESVVVVAAESVVWVLLQDVRPRPAIISEAAKVLRVREVWRMSRSY